MTTSTAQLQMKVKVTGKEERSTQSVWPRSSIEGGFSSSNENQTISGLQ